MRPRSTSAAATPPALPAPPAPTSPKPGATKRQRKSVPLGDVTNLFLRPETPTPIKPRRTARRPLPAPSDTSAVSSTCSSSASVTPALKPSSSASATPALEPSSSATVTPAPQPSSSATVTPAARPPATASATPTPEPSSAATVTPAPEPSSAATVTPAPKPSFAAVLDEEGSVFESPTIFTVYARRRTTEVEAEGRSNPTITNKGKEPIGAAASCPPLGKSTRNIWKKDTRPISSSASCREPKKKRPLARTPKLPEEFVKKQKAYFADVDAFELAEEEVSESELE